MRIKQLVIKDFRSHEDTTLDFDRFNFIVGENAVGKSSIAMAAEFLFTGKVAAITDEGGRGSDLLVRTNAKELSVQADVILSKGENLVSNRFVRSKSAKGHTFLINGKLVDVRLAQEGIEKITGVTTDVLSACLNSSRFISMDEKSQKSLLSQVLATEKIEIPKHIADLMRSIGGEGIVPNNPVLDSVDDVDLLHKTHYAVRTETNRDIKALGTMTEPEASEDVPDYKSTWKLLDDLRSELTKATAQKAREEERYDSAVNNAAGRRKSLQQYKKAAEDRMLSEEDAARYQAIVDNRDKHDVLVGKINSCRQSIATAEAEARNEISNKRGAVDEKRRGIQAQIAQKEEQIEILTRIKSADCPTCQRALSAKDKAALGSRLDDELVGLQKSLKQTDAEMPSLNIPESEALTKLRKTFAKMENELAAIGDIAEAEAKMRAHREAIVEADRCDRELKAITDPVAPDTAALATKIDELNTRIGKGEEVLNQVAAIERERQAFDDWKAKKAALEAKVEVLAQLIDFFGPNGIKSKLVGDKIGPFTDAMNEVLFGFGYKVAFTLEPYRFLIFRENDPMPRTVKQLSESEGLRFGIAFQVALAMATGLRFVIIDRADMLIGDNRAALMSVLLESELEQAIVLASSDRPAPTDLPDGLRFIQLGQQAVAA